MRSIQITVLGIITFAGALLGINNGLLLLSMYVDLRPNGTFYFPPLNIIGDVWILLGVIGVLLGVLLIITGVIDIARNAVVWVLGLTVYALLLVLSIAQLKDYFANASYSGEDAYGLLGIIVAICLLVYLITPKSRAFFRQVRRL